MAENYMFLPANDLGKVLKKMLDLADRFLCAVEDI